MNEVGRENIRYQCDFYHLQIEHGNLAKFVSQNVGKIEHVQVAQVRELIESDSFNFLKFEVPDRHEPDSEGEINYKYVLSVLQKAGYNGYIGLEYSPAGKTTEGLAWMQNN